MAFFIAVFMMITSCGKRTTTSEINIDLYLNAPLTKESQEYVSDDIVKLLAPIDCNSEKGIIPKLVVHRIDLDPSIRADVTIPFSKANQIRKSWNLFSFKHYQEDYKSSFKKVLNIPVFFKEGSQVEVKQFTDLDNKGITFTCCQNNSGSSSSGYFSSFEELYLELINKTCSSEDVNNVNVIYKMMTKEPVNFPEDNTPNVNNEGKDEVVPPNLYASISDIFNSLGNNNIDPKTRLSRIAEYDTLFASNCYVKEIGANNTAFEPIPIADYLERLAINRSLDSIEIIEALADDQGKFWEIRVKENHTHIRNQ